jgi:DNA-binding HxlR family transcriptional regulator
VALPKDYDDQDCSMAKALEVIGERWTLLIVRDAFYGVRRFSDFIAHLDIPRAVLTARLAALVNDGVLERAPGPGKRDEYALTDKGKRLWPILRSLMNWGDAYYSPAGVRRVLRHDADGGTLDDAGRCRRCRAVVTAADTRVEPGPGLDRAPRADPVSAAFAEPKRLLESLRS